MFGIDISHHNGSIDFSKVYAASVDAVIIKATEGGSYIDPKFVEHYTNASKHSFNIGFYHFLYEYSEPKKQALNFYNAIKDKKYNVIPILDAERNNAKFTREKYTDFCIEFLEEFKRLSGMDCIVYTYTSFANNFMDSRLRKYKLWEANYSINNGNIHSKFGLTNIWGKDIVGHQYTSTGKVNGIAGNVDLNNFNEAILIATEEASKDSVGGVCKVYELCKDKAVTRGSKGTHVYVMQSMGAMLGMYNGKIDGDAGANTENFIINYNNKFGLANGNAKSFGPKCWEHIFNN